MWEPGQVVAEARWLQVYADAPAGGYRYLVGVTTEPGTVRVAVTDAAGASPPDGRLLVGRAVAGLPDFPSPPAGAWPIHADLGGLIRLTHAVLDPPPGDLAPGEPLTVTLYWQALADPPADYTLFLHLTDADGQMAAQDDAPPLGGQFPTGTWRAGDRYVTSHTLTPPTDSAGPYALYVGMYRWPSLDRLPVTQEGIEQPDGRVRLG